MTRPAIVPFVFLYRLTQHAQPRDLLPTFVTWLVLGGHADIHSSQENGRGGSFWTRTAGVEQYEPDCFLRYLGGSLWYAGRKEYDNIRL